jgi:uncharacterized protein YbbC (DUF1343 family)
MNRLPPESERRHMMVHNGIDELEEKDFAPLQGSKVGLLINQASVDRHCAPTRDLFLARSSFTVKAFFGPQHGLAGTTQDNMIEWQGFTDRKANIPVHSLYGETRTPADAMLEGIDTFVIDLFDVGARYYTFLWTAYLSMKACAKKKIRVVVLDRPNPLNGVTLEGPLLSRDYLSFVGLYPLIIRHGMTMGEILSMVKDEEKIDVDLQVIPLKGWKRAMWFDETGLPWVIPSPNMPTLDTALVYPGFCLLEGTSVSEGRGTTRPFEFFGAPYVDPYHFVSELRTKKLPGVHFRPASFEPTFQKHKGAICGGAQMHLTDRGAFRSVITVVTVLQAFVKLHGGDFSWKEPPYEYEYEKLPFDILAGSGAMRRHIEAGTAQEEILEEWKADEDTFAERREPYLLYG